MGWYTGLPKWAQIVLPVLVAAVVALAVVLLIDDDGDEAVAPTSTTTSTTVAPTTTAAPTTTVAPTTTTTPPPALTLEALSEQIGTLVPANMRDPAWECEAESTGPLTAGSIATCHESPPPTEGEVHTVTVLVLDDAGTYAATRSGNDHVVLNAGDGTLGVTTGPPLPASLNCTNLLATDSAFTQEAQREQLTPEQTYFGVVLYYFLQDRSPLMDIDNNGIPCETLIEPSVVDTVWAGGWITSRWD